MTPGPVVNGAAWPTAPDDGAMPHGPIAQREAKQQAVIRRRVLTAAGNRVALPVTLAATTLAVTLAPREVDANYGVVVTPNWGTTVWVTAKTTTGYTVNFGTGAPANAACDATSFRSES